MISDDDLPSDNAVLRNLADGSLMQNIACLRWYYMVLSKILLVVCPLHCDIPVIKELDGRG
jgi:hypothetical protein